MEPVDLKTVSQQPRDPRKVAVMHGRDLRARQWMYDWLRRIGLVPLEWSHLVELTAKGTPYSGEAVEAAFDTAQAVVVLFTPDEIGMLHPELNSKEGAASDDGAQPRLNVVLEAGMALQSHQDQTILVEIGTTRPISDLGGRNTVHLTGVAKGLNELANRLENAGCAVDKTGGDWLETGDLEELPALRRIADQNATRLISTPAGGVAAFGPEGSSFRVFRAHGERIECRAHDGERWTSWSEVGTIDEGPIGLGSASIGRGHVEVFALLPRGEVLHNWWRYEDGWQPEFQSLGLPFGEQPATRINAGSREAGHQEVFVEAANGEIAHIWWNRGWCRTSNSATSLGDGWRRFSE
ncbi:MAG TPA: TIR domain-containing protein [Solirubrobacterales bacterium]